MEHSPDEGTRHARTPSLRRPGAAGEASAVERGPSDPRPGLGPARLAAISRPPLTPHYNRDGLVEVILDGLSAIGASRQAPSIEDLAPVDHFHTRGRDATLELLALSDVGPDARVLDVGGGIGGAARLLASAADCRVTVLDLTEEYVRTGRELTRRVGLSERVAFVHGDALRAPFDSGAFDVVWTQHATMNVVDKPAFFARCGDCCVLVAGSPCTRSWPGPCSRSAFRPLGKRPGDQSPALARAPARAARRARLPRAGVAGPIGRVAGVQPTPACRRVSAPAPPALGLHLLLGSEYRAMFANQVANLEDERTRVVMAVWKYGRRPAG